MESLDARTPPSHRGLTHDPAVKLGLRFDIGVHRHVNGAMEFSMPVTMTRIVPIILL